MANTIRTEYEKYGVWNARTRKLSRALAEIKNYPSYATLIAKREGKQRTLKEDIIK